MMRKWKNKNGYESLGTKSTEQRIAILSEFEDGAETSRLVYLNRNSFVYFRLMIMGIKLTSKMICL